MFTLEFISRLTFQVVKKVFVLIVLISSMEQLISWSSFVYKKLDLWGDKTERIACFQLVSCGNRFGENVR